MEKNLDDMVKATTRGSLIILAGQVSGTIILAIGMLLVARVLGPANYGAFNKAQSVVQITALIANLGLGASIARHIALYRQTNEQKRIKTIIQTGIIINFFVGTILATVVYLLSGYIANDFFNEPQQQQYIRYLAPTILGNIFNTLAYSVTIGFERMELRSIHHMIYSFLKSIVSPVLVFIGFGTLGAIIGHTSPVLISACIGLFFISLIYKKIEDTGESTTYWETAKQLLTFGFPLYLSSLLQGMLPHLFTTILALNVSNELIGNYGVALNFTVLVTFVTVPINTTIFPLFSKLTQDDSELKFLYRNGVKYSTLFGIPITIGLMALADQITSALFQDKYQFAGHFIRIYFLTFLLIGFGSVCNAPLLNSQNLTDKTFRSTLLRVALAIPLSLYLIPKQGVIGLLITLFISATANTLLNLHYVETIFNYRIDTKFLTQISVISIACYLIVYNSFKILTYNPWIELILGAITIFTIYLLGFILLKVFDKKDLDYLENLSNNFGPLKPLMKILIAILRTRTYNHQ